MSLFNLLLEVFINVSIQSVLVMNLLEDGRIMCLAALFADSQIHMEVRAKITIRSSFLEIVFFSVHSAVVKCQANIPPFGFNCRLWLACLGRKDWTVRGINLINQPCV